jgi:hypothetical protein
MIGGRQIAEQALKPIPKPNLNTKGCISASSRGPIEYHTEESARKNNSMLLLVGRGRYKIAIGLL